MACDVWGKWACDMWGKWACDMWGKWACETCETCLESDGGECGLEGMVDGDGATIHPWTARRPLDHSVAVAVEGDRNGWRRRASADREL